MTNLMLSYNSSQPVPCGHAVKYAGLSAFVPVAACSLLLHLLLGPKNRDHDNGKHEGAVMALGEFIERLYLRHRRHWSLLSASG